MDVRDFDLQSERKAEDAKMSFFSNIRAKLAGRPKPQDESMSRISRVSNNRPSRPRVEKASFAGSVMRPNSPPQVSISSKHDNDMDFPIRETDTEDERENIGGASAPSTPAHGKSVLRNLNLRSPQDSAHTSEQQRPMNTSLSQYGDLRQSLGSRSKHEKPTGKILNRQADASLQSVHESEREGEGLSSSYCYSKDEIMI